MSVIALEIHAHLADGRIAKFVQEDPVAAQAILAHIQPNKVFSQHHISLGDGHSLTTIPCATIVRLDLITPNPPEWTYHHGAHSIREVDEADFRTGFKPDALETSVPGDIVTVYAEIELANSARFFVEVQARVEPRLPMEQIVFIQQLYVSGGLQFRTQRGVAIINPANITRMTFHPGPAQIPPGVWMAASVRP